VFPRLSGLQTDSPSIATVSATRGHQNGLHRDKVPDGVPGQQLPKFFWCRQCEAKKGLMRIVYTGPAASGMSEASSEVLIQRCLVRGRHLLSAEGKDFHHGRTRTGIVSCRPKGDIRESDNVSVEARPQPSPPTPCWHLCDVSRVSCDNQYWFLSPSSSLRYCTNSHSNPSGSIM
jgi:hypothetical protein